ncbi:LOW QUALITY PROTEIN: hypothetical protein KUTeg_000737 [Tegillarca granosa]|uniref:Uncharacterized protein n=1 Tax=Tegillarca granosa TaxID=220873 RepID=A0ABQ9FYE1_TEGGR|nr:LOW QUALITY PROTEIN: hypothetical protein KUTeg_000737 [Tegillarca granosa]
MEHMSLLSDQNEWRGITWNNEMPPRKNCSCVSHEKYSEGRDYKVFRIDARKFRIAVINHLKANNELFNHSTFLCTACVSVAEGQLKCSAKKKLQIDDFFEEVIKAIEGGFLGEEKLTRLSIAIGRTTTKAIFDDSVNLGMLYQNDLYLQSLNVKDYISERNAVVLGFLRGICGTQKDLDDTKTNVKIAKAIEHVYNLTNDNFVAPLCFSSNLLTYYITGSKNACVLNSSGSPAGSYTTISKWINNQSIEPLSCPENPDVITFFDNNQVLERKWRVKYNFKSSTSVLTTVVHIIPDLTRNLQMEDKLSPRHWLSIKMITKEQLVKNNAFVDSIDDISIKRVEAQNQCSERYAYVPSQHRTTLPDVKMGEPCFENPCSYEAVEKVFEHIITTTMGNSKRRWTILGCDGYWTLRNKHGESVVQIAMGDHHKSWQILEIFLHSMADELLVVYCRHELKNDVSPTVRGFYKFIEEAKNPNYLFLCNAIFTYCLALHIFRAGVRRNNASVIDAALYKFSPLFYGLNMPFYMETYLRDRVVREQSPAPVKDFLQENATFSVSGNISKGEGGDFVVENRNRKVKKCLPSGLPTENKWLSVYRNIDRLDKKYKISEAICDMSWTKVRTNTCSIFAIAEEDPDYMYEYDLTTEKTEFRKFVRKNGYLKNPLQLCKHTTMSAKSLDENLVTFNETSLDNQTAFMKCAKIIKCHKKFTPVFILADDRKKYDDVANKTKQELVKIVEDNLSSLNNKALNNQWKKIKKEKKLAIVTFLKEVQEICDQ